MTQLRESQSSAPGGRREAQLPGPAAVATTSEWIAAAEAWRSFATRHPEFGIRPTANSFIHFNRTHGAKLIAVDAMRKAAFRGRLIADSARFDVAVFNLLSTGAVDGPASLRPGHVATPSAAASGAESA